MNKKGLLVVDDKWSITYEPDRNDRPTGWLRYGEPYGEWDENNSTTALFYALLETTERNTK
tara:strand:- start:66 stop:248 length:183 start_codon:yes stop_codon:yes gene_type:complete